MDNENRVRLSVYMDKDLSAYMDKESKRLGISKSGFINMLVSNDKMQKDVLSLSGGLNDMANRIIELQKNIKE